ncbi:MAG: YCII-related protein [Modestobacter sp.]|nr:YCII-related protein [Modestobacter sp.]
MRFMVIVKASEASERGDMPSTDELGAMGQFNEELVKAGVLLAGEGLTPSSAGARVRFDADSNATVVDGPFTETKELIAGFWILQVSSREEALEWVKRAPFREGEVEVRRVFEAEDFTNATPEQLAAEDRLRATVAEQQGA